MKKAKKVVMSQEFVDRVNANVRANRAARVKMISYYNSHPPYKAEDLRAPGGYPFPQTNFRKLLKLVELVFLDTKS